MTPQPTARTPVLLTPKELAALFRRPESWARRQTIVARVWVGNQYLFRESDAIEFINNGGEKRPDGDE